MNIDEKIAEIESEMPFSLDPHQKIGAKFLYNNRNIILADKMGLGKTATALTGAELCGVLDKRVLIPCSKAALSVWPDQIETWFPKYADRVVVIEGSKQKRLRLWHEAGKQKRIAVATYGSITQDIVQMPMEWDLKMPDEAHKAMRNHKTVAYAQLERVQAKQEIIITGTPASKGVLHMYGYLHSLYPKRFPSYWAFINRYMLIEDGQFGKEFLGSQNMDELRDILSTIMIRRMTSAGMPKKHRRRFNVKMNKEEQKIYDIIDKTNILKVSDGTYLLSPSEMSNQLRLRQLLVCPKLLDPVLGYGTGIEAIVEHIEEQELTHSVVFCPFKSAFPFLSTYVRDNLKKPTYSLIGGMSSTDVRQTIKKWEATGGVMFCSIQFATSFDLTAASTGFMLGFDWDPDNNYQAEDRIHRRSSEAEDVIIYYVLHNSILVEKQLQIMDAKTRMTYHDNSEFIPKDPDADSY